MRLQRLARLLGYGLIIADAEMPKIIKKKDRAGYGYVVLRGFGMSPLCPNSGHGFAKKDISNPTKR